MCDKRKITWITYFSLCLIVLMGSMLFYGTLFIVDTFGNVTADALVFHLFAPLDGQNPLIVYDALTGILASSVFIVRLYVYLLLLSLLVSKFLEEFRTAVNLSKKTVRIVPFVWLTYTAFFVNAQLDLADYFRLAFTDSMFIENNYIDPRAVQITFPEVKRNLILIYLESIETSFMSVAEGGGSETNLIPELTDLAYQHTHFSNTDLFGGFQEVAGTGWTVAGMVASTSGLPLIVSPLLRDATDGGGNMMGTFDYFLPGAYPLGRVLERVGYSNYLLVGSDARFGGRDRYFSQHGNHRILDVYTAEDYLIIPEGHRVFWGMEDEHLFTFARQQLSIISQRDEPFNFTMLTVDTHFPDGWVSSYTPNYYARQYSNVLRGSSRQVYEFIQWISTQDWFENTTIIIIGDHLSMQADVPDYLYEGHERTIFNVIINSQATGHQYHNRTFTTMDWFPTILAAMGIEVEGNRLGLGTNLFSDEYTLAERYGLDYLNQQLLQRSRFYLSLNLP